MFCEVSPLLHANVYGSVPPVTTASAVVVPPLQAIAPAFIETTSADGSEIVAVAFATQELASVTVTM